MNRGPVGNNNEVLLGRGLAREWSGTVQCGTVQYLLCREEVARVRHAVGMYTGRRGLVPSSTFSYLTLPRRRP